MKRLVLFTASLMASTAIVAAADIYEPPAQPEMVYEPSAFNWTGVYAGIHAGFGGDRFEYPLFIAEDSIFGFPDGDATGQFDLTSSGFFAGGQVGANWQLAPRWVVGVEADGSWSEIKGELGLNAELALASIAGSLDLAGDIEAGSQINWFSTIRGRIGFLPTERFMVYATGGGAVGETESFVQGSGSITTTPIIGPPDSDSGSFDLSTSETNWGYSVGGGFEYAVTDNITLKTEYLFIDLGEHELIGGDIGSISVDTHIHTIKAGLNFLYGVGGGSGADLGFFPEESQTSDFNWTGVYAGIHGGYGGDRFEYPFGVGPINFGIASFELSGEPHLTSSGFFAGGQVGANWQFANNFVVGVEADGAWFDIKGELGIESDPCCGGYPGANLELGSQVNWYATIRGRLGFLPTERLMIYGTGGGAVGETESYAKASIPGLGSGEISTDDTNWGWSAGGGFEYAVTDNLTFKTEYLYVDLGETTLAGGGIAGIDVDTHFHTIKAGINLLWP